MLINYAGFWYQSLQVEAGPGQSYVSPPCTLFPTNPNANALRDQIAWLYANGAKWVGIGVSATTTMPATSQPTYQPFHTLLPREQCQDEWVTDYLWPGYNNRWVLNGRYTECALAIANHAVESADLVGANTIILDNMYFGEGAHPLPEVGRVEWHANNFAILVVASNTIKNSGKKLIVNTGTFPTNWNRFAPFVDGILFERSLQWLDNTNTMERQIRAIKDVGITKWVGLINLIKPNVSHEENEGMGEACVALLTGVPDQTGIDNGVYVSTTPWEGASASSPYYKYWPKAWYEIARLLGEPISDFIRHGETFVRSFENGNVILDSECKFNLITSIE